jgi:hypothetical protein
MHLWWLVNLAKQNEVGISKGTVTHACHVRTTLSTKALKGAEKISSEDRRLSLNL